MKSTQKLEQAISAVMRLWKKDEFDQALEKVDHLLEIWPGNAQLYVLWASLVQLQDDPKYTLIEAKQALERAIELDKDSPVGYIELGHYLDKVEDDPRAAHKAYSKGVALARQLLLEGLVGQAEARCQLDLDKKQPDRHLLENLLLVNSRRTRK